MEQLATQGPTVAEVPKSKGLFWELFGGRTEALQQHVLEHPDQYTSELTTMVRDLSENRRKADELSSQEQALLNTAALTFYQYRPAVVHKPKAPTREASRPEARPVDPPARPEIGVDVPAGAELQPYWWM